MHYTVYENRVHNYAAVHRAICGYLKMHGGVSSTTPPTGEYHEGFERAEAALNKARSTGRDVRIYRGCNPPIANSDTTPRTGPLTGTQFSITLLPDLDCYSIDATKYMRRSRRH